MHLLIQNSSTTQNELGDLSPVARSQLSTSIKPPPQLRLINKQLGCVSRLANYSMSMRLNYFLILQKCFFYVRFRAH